MIIDTRNFGEIEVDDSKVIYFNDGIPGLNELKKYILVVDDEGSPFYWLQSIESSDIAFVMIDAFKIIPEYNPHIEDEIIDSLGEHTNDELLIYNIVVIPEDINKMSVNLKAPIMINTRTRKGIQVILNNDDYAIKHYLYDYINKDTKKVGER